MKCRSGDDSGRQPNAASRGGIRKSCFPDHPFIQLSGETGQISQIPRSRPSECKQNNSNRLLYPSRAIAVKPQFEPESLGIYTVVEGESKNISLRAVGNPPEIDYSWSVPESVSSSDRVKKRKHLLTLHDARRSDAGSFDVVASNSYGDFKTRVSVQLDVRYPPE